MKIRRRALATSTLLALAGCVEAPGDPSADSNQTDPGNATVDDEQPDPNQTTSEDTTEEDVMRPPCPEAVADRSISSPGDFPDITIHPDPVPRDAQVRVCVEPVEPFTEEHPAAITVELTNLADETVTFPFAASPPYKPNTADHDEADAALALVPSYREWVTPPDHEFVPDAPSDDCWRITHWLGWPDYPLEAELAPGESVRETYQILADEEGECLVEGTYRTENKYYSPLDDEPWGFEIVLER